MNKESFIYAGHSFVGVRQWESVEDFKVISSNIYSQVLNDQSNTSAPFVWNHNDFYNEAEKAGYGKMDLFLMDNKFHVIPCGHFLAIYGSNDDILYRQFCKIQSDLYKISLQKKELMDNLIVLVKDILKTKKAMLWNLKEDKIHLSTSLYCNGYIAADIDKVYIEGNQLTVHDAVSDESFNENDLAFTIDALLDIINAFVIC